VTGFLDHVLNAAPWVVLVIVGLVVFVEDALFVGFIVPGETAAILGGVAASMGHVPLWAVMAVVIVAAIAGDSVGYEVGKAIGPRILASKRLDSRRERLDQAQEFLARRGGWAVLLGRWVAFFRAVMPALAGTSKMHYRRFLTFNAIGGALWGAVVVTLGYVAGASYQKVEKAVGRDGAIAVAAIAVLAFVVWEVRKRIKERRPSGHREEAPEQVGPGAIEEPPAEPRPEGEHPGAEQGPDDEGGPARSGVTANGDDREDRHRR
jgi:membrane protein DedA with SNARE-associated domain